jgi:hypothetical protein
MAEGRFEFWEIQRCLPKENRRELQIVGSEIHSWPPEEKRKEMLGILGSITHCCVLCEQWTCIYLRLLSSKLPSHKNSALFRVPGKKMRLDSTYMKFLLKY